MVAFVDVPPSGSGRSLRSSHARPLHDPQVQKTNCAGCSPLAGLRRFIGFVLMLAGAGIGAGIGAGMWRHATPQLDAEMMLLRLAISILLFCAGAMVLRRAQTQLRDEIQLDPRSGTLRHIQRGRDGIARTRRSLKLADLGAITIVDDQVILRSVAGDVVLHLSGLPRAQLHLLERKLRRN
jgi:hypothetical protein